MEENDVQKTLMKNPRLAEIREAYDNFQSVLKTVKESDKSVWDEFDRVEEAKKEFSQVLKEYVREVRADAAHALKKDPIEEAEEEADVDVGD